MKIWIILLYLTSSLLGDESLSPGERISVDSVYLYNLESLEDISTKDLFEASVVYRMPNQDQFHRPIWLEIKKRPEELEHIIREKIKQDVLSLAEIDRCFYMAHSIDPSAGAEIARELARHKSIKKFDSYYMAPSKEIFDLLNESPRDEMNFIEEMISAGRIEKGSDIEKRWRRALKPKFIQQKRIPKEEVLDDSRSSKESVRSVVVNEDEESKSQSRLPWTIGALVLLLGSFAYWRLTKSKS